MVICHIEMCVKINRNLFVFFFLISLCYAIFLFKFVDVSRYSRAVFDVNDDTAGNWIEKIADHVFTDTRSYTNIVQRNRKSQRFDSTFRQRQDALRLPDPAKCFARLRVQSLHFEGNVFLHMFVYFLFFLSDKLTRSSNNLINLFIPE